MSQNHHHTHLANLPLLPGVVEVGGGGADLGDLVVLLGADHAQGRLLHEAAAGHGTRPVIMFVTRLAGNCGSKVLAVATPGGQALEHGLGDVLEDDGARGGLLGALLLSLADPCGPEGAVKVGVKHAPGLENEIDIDLVLESDCFKLVRSLARVSTSRELFQLPPH